MGTPMCVTMAKREMIEGACAPLAILSGLTQGAAHLIESSGTNERKRIYMDKMYSGQWAGTMCLTEPQTGSALGDIKTMARPAGDTV